ncbi:MAG: hypothetical protein Q9216_004778 [Gyalolechia sp. 2 TL-2023]
MRVLSFLTSLLVSSTFSSAIPASNIPPPTIITQPTAADTTTITNASIPISPNPFTIRFPVPGTSTVLWIAPGRRLANPDSLAILISRVQSELSDLIAQYGPQAVPGNVNAPKYSYLTTTPAGVDGYFFISALARGPRGLTYGVVADVLRGLRIYLLEEGRNEQVVFEVEGEGEQVMEAFGGVSVGQGDVEGMQEMVGSDMTVEEFLARNPTLLSPNPIEVHLSCTFARPLLPAAIVQLLHLARMEAASKIRDDGPDAFLPGQPAGAWKKRGDFGAEITILGLPPKRLTWRIMAAAVEGLKEVLVVGKVAREAQCNILTGEDEAVGVMLLRAFGDAGIGP